MRILTVLLASLLIAACSGASDDDGPARGSEAETDSGRRGVRDAATDTRPQPDTASDLGTDAPSTVDTGTAQDTGVRDTGRPDVRDRVEDECAEVSAVGDPAFAPVDIVWVIDTSGSMNEETILVQEKLNEFVEFIEASGLDVRVVMIAGDTVCVPEPLSGGGCPDSDSARYRHVRRVVNSHDAFENIVDMYPQYQDFLRPEAVKHFVVVSDDESAWEAARFRSEMEALGFSARSFVFHAIVSLVESNCGLMGICEGCSGPHGDAEAKGDRYIVATEMTGGTASSICEPDWTPIFDGIAANVIAGAVLPCAYLIPDLGSGLEIVYDRVDVTINGVLLSHLDDESGCSSAPGWFYDDNAAPTTIHICPGWGICGLDTDDAEIEIEFGCVKG